MITVEVAYATPEKQVILPVTLKNPTSARDVIQQSGITALFPDIDLDTVKIGIFSKKVSLDHIVNDQDRIEMYRELTLNPREKRFKRIFGNSIYGDKL